MTYCYMFCFGVKSSVYKNTCSVLMVLSLAPCSLYNILYIVNSQVIRVHIHILNIKV